MSAAGEGALETGAPSQLRCSLDAASRFVAFTRSIGDAVSPTSRPSLPQRIAFGWAFIFSCIDFPQRAHQRKSKTYMPFPSSMLPRIADWEAYGKLAAAFAKGYASRLGSRPRAPLGLAGVRASIRSAESHSQAGIVTGASAPVKSSQNSVRPSASVTSTRQSEPSQNVSGSSKSSRPASFTASRRAVRRSGSSVPSLSGRSEPSRTLKWNQACAAPCFKAGAQSRLSAASAYESRPVMRCL